MIAEMSSFVGTGSGERQETVERKHDTHWLTTLAEKWRANREGDLALRYETGAQLNDHFGSPDSLQKAKKALKDVSEELGISAPVLYRMRQFAASFKSFADFKEKHASVMTWTDARALLPQLDANGEAAPAAVEASKLQGMKRSMKHLSTNLQKAREGLSGEDKRALLDAFQEFAKAVEDCLKVSITVGQVRQGVAPTLSQTECAAETALRASA